MDKRAIEPVPLDCLGQEFYSRYFLVPKREGGLRPIMDLRGLNLYLKDKKFCMITLQSIFPFIPETAWMASIDLLDAYFHISIHPSCRNYLRFAIGGSHFQYAALLFRLSSSPRVFTKVMVVIATHLHLQGVQIFQYIDDWLLLAASKEYLLSHITTTLNLLAFLGVVINAKKSNLVPSQWLQYIGAILDSTKGNGVSASRSRFDSQDWTKWFLYMFPPLPLIPRVVQKFLHKRP